MARLGDICTIYTGTGFPVQHQGNSQGKFPFYKVGDIAKNVTAGKVYLELCDNYVETDVVKKIKGSILPARTVVFAKIGEAVKLNRRAITSCECLIDNNAMGIAPNEAVLTLDYFYHYMCQLRLETLAEATTVPSVKKSIVENLDIPVPSIAEQQMISKTLNKLSELISLRKEQLVKLDRLVKSRFIELFGDPVSNPMGWELQRFDSLCENLDYRRKPITASEREAGIYPYYGASGIVDYVAGYLFDEDILLVSEDGANLLMRSTPIAFSVCGKAWVNNHAHVVRFEKMSMQKYIEVFFSLIDISDHITGSAQPKLNQAKLNAMMFPVPNDDRLETFLHFVEQIDKSKFDLRQSLEKLEMLKKSLMQQYFG